MVLQHLAGRKVIAASLETAPASAVALNQVGYLPALPKHRQCQCPRCVICCSLQFAGNEIVHRGTLSAPKSNAASGDSLQMADFSALAKPGSYLLELDSGNQSLPFRIAGDVYRDALRLTMRSYYGQRCGCNVDLGGGYAHPACHLSTAYHASSGKSGVLHNRGGWHDAGDYGRYIVNSGISTGTLLWAWELYQQRSASCRCRFRNRVERSLTFLLR